MKEKIKKFIYKINFKRTWIYFTAIGLLFGFICVFCECLAYAVKHYADLSFLDDELIYGITMYKAVYFVWGFLCTYIVCRLIEGLFKFFFNCISKCMRKDD